MTTVKTADLKNNLSRYLNRLRATGETIIVCDRDKPIATLAPIERDADSEWKRFRAEALARARKVGISIDIPASRPAGRTKPTPKPVRARDGRTDISTVTFARSRKDY